MIEFHQTAETPRAQLAAAQEPGDGARMCTCESRSVDLDLPALRAPGPGSAALSGAACRCRVPRVGVALPADDTRRPTIPKAYDTTTSLPLSLMDHDGYPLKTALNETSHKEEKHSLRLTRLDRCASAARKRRSMGSWGCKDGLQSRTQAQQVALGL